MTGYVVGKIKPNFHLIFNNKTTLVANDYPVKNNLITLLFKIVYSRLFLIFY